MSLYVTALNSGSNGNCYYIGNDEEAVLIDAGISCREIEKRMKRLELSMSKVKAVFITHEHADHCRGIRVLSKKHKLPVYFTPETLSNTDLSPENPFFIKLTSYKPVMVGKLEVLPFPICHDAKDPHNYIIKYNSVCVGVFTDIGVPCENVIRNFGCCNALFLEANYDTHMLATGNYPYHLKRRIDSDKGHLSNQQALDLLLGYKHPELSHVFLSHISKENNDLSLVYNLFESQAVGIKIVLTSRNNEIALYKISNATNNEAEIDEQSEPALRNVVEQLTMNFN